MNTKSGIEASHKHMTALAGTGLNQRTRLKIAIKEIMTEMGHDGTKIDEAIADVCNCDFRTLRVMFGLEPGKSNAVPEYQSFYRDPDEVRVGDAYAVGGDDWYKVNDEFILHTDKLIVEWIDTERYHMNVFRNGKHFGMLHLQQKFLKMDFEKATA